MKIKNLFILPLLAGLMLVGCKNKEVKPSEPEVIEPSEPSEPEVVLQGISISGEFKTEYYTSEEFDSTGIIVTATFSDDATKDVTSETEFSGFDSSVAGKVTVVAAYQEKTAEIEVTVITHPAEEALAKVAKYWNGSIIALQVGIFGTQGIFSAASYSVEDMKGFVSSMFVPEEFELANDWVVAEDGTNSCMYKNATLTVLEFYVYADTVYVKDGAIVKEGTEGAVATDVTCIEVYSYIAE